eukprot:g7312.t1
MKTLVSVLVVFAILATVARAQVELDFLQGTWEASGKNAAVLLGTPEGRDAVCRNILPSKCEAEIPLGTETYTFSGTSMTRKHIALEGITTMEKSATAMPTCASLNLHPIQYSVEMPLGEIQSYDLSTGQLMYRDARKGYDDCTILRLEVGRDAPYIEAVQHITFRGDRSLLISQGPDYSCTDQETECRSGFTGGTVADVDYMNRFTLTCTSGPCLDL